MDRNNASSSSNSLINSDFRLKDIISIKQFDKRSLEKVFDAASDYKKIVDKRDLSSVLKGKVVTLLFYEPSSRTRGSFDAAVKYLGGDTIVVENPKQTASVAKGETLQDTIQTFSCFSDAIVIRHYERGAALLAASVSDKPIINAGDGIGEHPTQALPDLFTIFEKFGRLSNLKGLIAGDLKNGRTVNSLLDGLSLYKNNKLYLLAPSTLKLRDEIKKRAEKNGLKLFEIDRVENIPKDCDFWYWTRVQKERFESEAEYKKVNNKFIVTKDLLNKYAGKKTVLMHPLPRVGEIETSVDDDPRAVYFRDQIPNGLYIRMALLTLILS